MNKKLISLAVAAAMAAPAAALAEATLYGKLHVSIDYADVDYYEPREAVTRTVYPLSEQTSRPDNTAAPVTIYNDTDRTTQGLRPGQSTTLRIPDPVDGQLVRVVGENGKVRTVPGTGQDFSGWGIASEGSGIPGAGRASRIGVKGSEDLGNGLKAIYQVELGLNLGDDNIPGGSNGISYRNTFAGLAGGFGTVLVGRHDTPLKISTGKLDLFADTMADYNGTVGFDDLRVDNAIAYISPSFSGFSFAGALVAPGGGTAGEGFNINSDQLNGAYSLAGIYNNGPWYASVAYESLSNEMFMDSAISTAGKQQCIDANGDATLTCNYVPDDYTKWRFGLGILDWNGFTLTGIYEEQSDIASGQTFQEAWYIGPDGFVSQVSERGVKKQQLWQVQAGYSFGNNMVKAMYGSVSRDDVRILGASRDVLSIDSVRADLEGDKQTWAVGFDHNFSKRTKVYALYTAVDDDQTGDADVAGVEWSGFSLGLMHKF